MGQCFSFVAEKLAAKGEKCITTDPAPARPTSVGSNVRHAWKIGQQTPKLQKEDTLACMDAFGVKYEPQGQRERQVELYDGPIPAFDPLQPELWETLNAKASSFMVAGRGSGFNHKPSGRVPCVSTRLDKAKFIDDLKRALVEHGCDVTLYDQDYDDIASAAAEQKNVTSFDDFPLFDFEHPSVEDRLRVSPSNLRKLQQFHADLARNSKAGLLSFAKSHYYELYDKDNCAVRTRSAAWELVGQYLKACVGKAGFSTFNGARTIRLEEHHCDGFKQALMQSFRDDNIPLTCDDTSGWSAGLTLVRLWTSPVHCKPLDREWCSLLQAGHRLNDPDLCPIICKIWATMNIYCVQDRKPDAPERFIAWPGSGSNEDEERNVFHRGARLPDQFSDWWIKASENAEVFRVSGAVPVSKLSGEAFKFMYDQSNPKDAPRAYYRFYLENQAESVYPCDHAVCLDDESAMRGEQEFLFPPYSAFQAISATWYETEKEKESYWIIEVRVFKDNKAVSDDVLLCPWI